MAMIDSLPESPTIIVAEAKLEHKEGLFGSLGSCTVVSNEVESNSNPDIVIGNSSRDLFIPEIAVNIFTRIDPTLFAGIPKFKAHPEMYQGDDKYFNPEDIHFAKVEIVEAPMHGELRIRYGNKYNYFPNENYLGNDKAVFIVTMGGYKIKVISFIKIVSQEDYSSKTEELRKTLCPDNDWLIDYQNMENGVSSLMNLYGFSSVTITTSKFDKATWVHPTIYGILNR